MCYFTQGILSIYAFGPKLSKDVILGSFSALSSILLTFIVHSVEI